MMVGYSHLIRGVRVCMIFLIPLLALFPLVSAGNISVYVRPLSGGSVVPNDIFSYVFNFTTDVNCSNVLLSYSKNIETDKYGIGYTSVDVSSLTETPAHICEYRSGSLRKVHSIGAGLFADIESSQDVNVKKDLVVNGSANFTGSASEVWVNGSRVCTQANGFCSGGNVSGSGTVGYLSRWSSSGSLADSVIFQSLSSITILGNLSVNSSSAKVNGKEVCLSDGTNCLSTPPSGWYVDGPVLLQNSSNSVNATTLWIDNVLHRVGINTYSPSQALDVVGNVNVTGNLSVSGYLRAGSYIRAGSCSGNYSDGDICYNYTGHKYCYYNSTALVRMSNESALC